jgi:hypothetical protein
MRLPRSGATPLCYAPFPCHAKTIRRPIARSSDRDRPGSGDALSASAGRSVCAASRKNRRRPSPSEGSCAAWVHRAYAKRALRSPCQGRDGQEAPSGDRSATLALEVSARLSRVINCAGWRWSGVAGAEALSGPDYPPPRLPAGVDPEDRQSQRDDDQQPRAQRCRGDIAQGSVEPWAFGGSKLTAASTRNTLATSDAPGGRRCPPYRETRLPCGVRGLPAPKPESG